MDTLDIVGKVPELRIVRDLPESPEPAISPIPDWWRGQVEYQGDLFRGAKF